MAAGTDVQDEDSLATIASTSDDTGPIKNKKKSARTAKQKTVEDKFEAKTRPDARASVQPTFTTLPAQAPMSYSGGGPVRLFIASLGNPPPYHATRHSAGHIMLRSIQSYLSLPPLSKSRTHAGGHLSRGADVSQPQWTLWQCPSQMNISGTPLLKAYKTFLDDLGPDALSSHAVVILHDEMEAIPAKLTLRRGPTSPRGHNGIKSVQQTLQGAGLMDKLMATPSQPRFLKVAIGIGRPAGGTRDKEDVSNYVLGPLTAGEKNGIEAKVAELTKMLEGEMGKIARASQ